MEQSKNNVSIAQITVRNVNGIKLLIRLFVLIAREPTLLMKVTEDVKLNQLVPLVKLLFSMKMVNQEKLNAKDQKLSPPVNSLLKMIQIPKKKSKLVPLTIPKQLPLVKISVTELISLVQLVQLETKSKCQLVNSANHVFHVPNSTSKLVVPFPMVLSLVIA